jgi:two-component system, NarL family, sensor kinase
LSDRPQPTLADLRQDSALYRILLDHASRGVRVQLLLRAALVVFVAVTVLAVPPARYRAGCYLTVAIYVAWSAGLGWLLQRSIERTIRLIWLPLLIDLAALAVLSVLAGQSEQSWTADILLNGFFVIPMLATTQLRPGIGAAVTIPTVAVYLGSSIAARHANGEPWASVLLRTGVLAALSLACVLLSSVQRSRVLTIAGLVSDRAALMNELVDVEGQTRQALAEDLHDGALQYVLAARQDLDDARQRGDAESFDRIDFALRESTDLLRSKVSQLHPAVLEHSGLLSAVEDLARSTSRDDLDVRVVAPGWDESLRMPSDDLLYSAARELLTNVAKHAHANSVEVRLERDRGWSRLTVEDNGRGIDPRQLASRVAAGHIGLMSQRVRAAAAGGHFRIQPGHPGTTASLELPDSTTRE